jgi:hypothetical protein
MNKKFLTANSLVPDNEVWVSPKTFNNSFSIKQAVCTCPEAICIYRHSNDAKRCSDKTDICKYKQYQMEIKNEK